MVRPAITKRLDNFPGFPEGVSGADFADRLQAQAERFGVEILAAQEVTGVGVDGANRVVRTTGGDEYAPGRCCSRLVPPTVASIFLGRTISSAPACTSARPAMEPSIVARISWSSAAAIRAGEESIFLTKFARKVTIANRGPELTASKVVVEKVSEHPDINVLTCVTATEFKGHGRLETVVLKDMRTGELREVHPAGVFVFVGLSPNTGILTGTVELDERGFIVTDGTLETSVSGIFAAGDCRKGSTKQAASAAGEGASVALAIRRYLQSRASGILPSDLAEAADEGRSDGTDGCKLQPAGRFQSRQSERVLVGGVLQ